MITVGIFAYNEDQSLASTAQTVIEAAKLADNIPVEIIIVNDGSVDNTEGVIADLKGRYANVSSITHQKNTGIGTAIRDIVNAATCEKICFVPGDDIFTLDTLKTMLLSAGKADIILHYHINSEVRHKGRAFLSFLYTSIYKYCFNLRLVYVNCIGIYPARLLREIDIRSKRHSIAAELNVKLILQGYSYYEVGSYMKPQARKSSALTFKNLADVVATFLLILYEVKTRNRDKYNKRHARVVDTV